ncbi:hypothetical protein ACWERW_41670, partial [Streptomyces sp. NPDC004012]
QVGVHGLAAGEIRQIPHAQHFGDAQDHVELGCSQATGLDALDSGTGLTDQPTELFSGHTPARAQDLQALAEHQRVGVRVGGCILRHHGFAPPGTFVTARVGARSGLG